MLEWVRKDHEKLVLEQGVLTSAPLNYWAIVKSVDVSTRQLPKNLDADTKQVLDSISNGHLDQCAY